MTYSRNETSLQEKTVLVVEDDASIGEMVLLVLTTETSYHIVLASDAFQALEMVKKRVPDLLVLDYHLPNMNGLELYDRLHAQKEFGMVPALFMSANVPTEALEQRHLCFLPKPFEVEALLQTVEGLLGE